MSSSRSTPKTYSLQQQIRTIKKIKILIARFICKNHESLSDDATEKDPGLDLILA